MLNSNCQYKGGIGTFYIDAHCDTLSKALDEGKELHENDLQFSFNKVNKLGGGIQTLACFIDSKFLNSEDGGFNRCNKILNKLKEYEQKNNCNILIRSKNDFLNAINKKETKVILSIENGAAISGNLSNVDYFYNQGVKIMSITWNDDNELGCGAKTKSDTGLTNLGINYIRKLNNLGIIVDVSHTSEMSFWDTVKKSTGPIVATHSNVYEICSNPRNLKDNQIKAIAKSGGMIGICFYSEFLNSKKRANVKDVVEHIKYVKELVGIDYVGLGSDFDGMSIEKTARGVESISKIDNITKELKLQGFSYKEIEKVMWENWGMLFETYAF